MENNAKQQDVQFGEKPPEEKEAFTPTDPEAVLKAQLDEKKAEQNAERAEQIQEAREAAQEALTKTIKQDFKSFSVLGRNLVGLSFIIFGIGHFMYINSISSMVPAMIPFASLWVVLTGIAFIAAGGCIVLQKQTYTAALYLSYLLAFLTLLVFVSPFSLSGIFQNVALIGALLMIADQYKK